METKLTEVGPISDFSGPLTPIKLNGRKLVVTNRNGEFGIIDGKCSHLGGPLGNGRLIDDYVECPWHGWKYHRCTGLGEPGYEMDATPAFKCRVADGRLYVDLASESSRGRAPHEPHPLTRPIVRDPGKIRVLGLSTTNMNSELPRYSTSEELLGYALSEASVLGAECKTLRLRDLKFRACEGYYSKASHACSWPCSITQADPEDELTSVYEGLIHWADVVILATPIRWGNASSLYYKMAERLNAIQNQVTIANRVMIRNKVISFIITGGQDNIQQVSGQMMSFFGELGFHFPQFPYIGHSRGWSAEDMENNIAYVKVNKELHAAARDLAARSVRYGEEILKVADEQRQINLHGRKGKGPARKSVVEEVDIDEAVAK